LFAHILYILDVVCFFIFCFDCVCKWDLTTRRSILSLSAHAGHPILALATLRDGNLITQGKDGTVKLWDMHARTSAGAVNATPLRTIETHSYSFCKMQLCEESGAPLLLLPCEEASNFQLMDLRAPATDPPAQLIECEERVPRNESMEEEFFSRMDEKEAAEMQKLLASRPPQYQRKVGMCMAAKFFKPDNSNRNSSFNADSAASSSSPVSLPELNVAWATEGGVFGVWDIRAARHLFQQKLHKDTSQFLHNIL
jgi:WD40 repeat protein